MANVHPLVLLWALCTFLRKCSAMKFVCFRKCSLVNSPSHYTAVVPQWLSSALFLFPPTQLNYFLSVFVFVAHPFTVCFRYLHSCESFSNPWPPTSAWLKKRLRRCNTRNKKSAIFRPTSRQKYRHWDKTWAICECMCYLLLPQARFLLSLTWFSSP